MAIRYVCSRKCFHNGSLYRVGDYAHFRNASDGPQGKNKKLLHFEPVEDGEPAPEKARKRATGVKVNEKDV